MTPSPVAALVEHDDITDICAVLRRQIRDDIAAAHARVAEWEPAEWTDETTRSVA